MSNSNQLDPDQRTLALVGVKLITITYAFRLSCRSLEPAIDGIDVSALVTNACGWVSVVLACCVSAAIC